VCDLIFVKEWVFSCLLAVRSLASYSFSLAAHYLSLDAYWCAPCAGSLLASTGTGSLVLMLCLCLSPHGSGTGARVGKHWLHWLHWHCVWWLRGIAAASCLRVGLVTHIGVGMGLVWRVAP